MRLSQTWGAYWLITLHASLCSTVHVFTVNIVFSYPVLHSIKSIKTHYAASSFAMQCITLVYSHQIHSWLLNQYSLLYKIRLTHNTDSEPSPWCLCYEGQLATDPAMQIAELRQSGLSHTRSDGWWHCHKLYAGTDIQYHKCCSTQTKSCQKSRLIKYRVLPVLAVLMEPQQIGTDKHINSLFPVQKEQLWFQQASKEGFAHHSRRSEHFTQQNCDHGDQ